MNFNETIIWSVQLQCFIDLLAAGLQKYSHIEAFFSWQITKNKIIAHAHS